MAEATNVVICKFDGGYIEIIPTTDPCLGLVINETGTLDNLPPNLAATEFVRPDVSMLDCIRGNALLIKFEKEEMF